MVKLFHCNYIGKYGKKFLRSSTAYIAYMKIGKKTHIVVC
jgi:hypothetical protein